jgi:hypothetical protein
MALHARRRAGGLALLLALCAFGQRADAAPRPAIMFAIGLTIGLLTLFRPIFIGFVPLIALAVPRDRFKSLVLVVAGAGPPASCTAVSRRRCSLSAGKSSIWVIYIGENRV